MWWSSAWIVSLALLLVLAGTARAAEPAAKCEAQKLKAAGKYADCRLKAEAKAITNGEAPNYSKCDAKLALKYQKVEQKFGSACPAVGDVENMQADVSQFSAGVVASTRGELFCSNDPNRVEPDSPGRLPNPSGPTTLEGGVLQLNDSVYMAPGFGNTFLVVTPEGNVVIDTSLVQFAASHKTNLQAIDDGPIRYIILTHGHVDHTRGVNLWKEPGTSVIAQREHVEFLHYQNRLAGLFNHRNSAQFSGLLGLPFVPFLPPDAPVENYGAEILATDLFDTFCEFRLGGLTFQIIHTPGETYDHLTVWIPEYRIAFSGDNFYASFPNMYTLRGTKPRWALDYVESLDRVLSWQPEIVAPSHFNPIYGNTEVTDQITRYRDAILYVHDETVRGMNAGKSVFTLMNEIVLPPELEVGEGYGAIAWSSRGIYEGYIGFFEENPASMYAAPPLAIYPDLATLAGGAGPVATRAEELVTAGSYEEALRMTDVALETDPNHLPALEARLDALEALEAASANINELGWLGTAIDETEQRIADLSP